MRKRIQDLASARFQQEKPAVQFSCERLEFEVLQEEIYQGSFSITSVNGVNMRGFVRSSNPRMAVCAGAEFEGTKAEISFAFYSDGLIEGDIQKGDFTVIVNGGEYNLSFVASVSRFYTATTIGRVKNLFDFANLAQSSYAEAYRIFTAPFFENIIKETEVRERLLYRGVGGRKASMQGMEEFLIGIRKKRRIQVELLEQEKRITQVTQEIREHVQIKKDHWGYLVLQVSSDNEAVKPVKERLTSEDFVGNRAEVEFLICAEKLHGGDNFARLRIRGISQSICCTLCIRKGRRRKERPGREVKGLQQRLLSLYLDYRMQRIGTGIWARESCECLERLKGYRPKDYWYQLYHAHALLINKQRQEAEWLMDDFLHENKDRDTPLYAYYLYLCTLREREPSYIQKTFHQIQEIYLRHQEDQRLFLILLFLDPQLNQSRSRKLTAIEEKAGAGMHSPVLYMEAYDLIRHEVYLMKQPNAFIRSVLYWAVGQKALTSEVAGQVVRLIAQLRAYHPLWYPILEACCLEFPGPDSLQVMCSFCIRWSLTGEKAFAWYERGICQELRIAGLYEAWLACVSGKKHVAFPKTVLLYFQYQSGLSDERKAQLYANIVQNKESLKLLYTSYQKQIQDFAIMQMQKGRIDEHLAILYESEWKMLAINPQMAKALAQILYTHHFYCPDEQAARVVIFHRELKREQVVKLSRQQAYIRLYTGSYCIFVEDEYGVRYLPKESWELKRLMQPSRCIRQCVQEAPLEIPHLLHYFDSRKTYHTFQEEDLSRLMGLIEMEEIAEDYRQEMRPEIIEYYYHSFTGEALDRYLREVECGGLKRGIRNKLVELMIARGVYDRAYQLLEDYGSEQASVSKLLIVAGQRIEEIGYQKEEHLIGLCRDIFKRGKYNESVLSYLCRYFQGEIRELEQLWLAAREFELDTYELEERYLTQLLYTESYTEYMEQIFQSYNDAMGQELLIAAYLSHFSYQNFVREMPISDGFFRCLGRQLELGNALNEICKLAYFQWLSHLEAHTSKQEQQLEDFLQEFLKRRKYFAFYQKLPLRLLRRYHLHDRMILEYRSDSAKRVLIDYCYTAGDKPLDYVEEDMEQMYEGIFVKQFVVFFGEEIPYYIKEESPNRQVITESGHIHPAESVVQGDESYYDLLNGMMVGYHLKDYQTLAQLYGQYLTLRQQTEEEFWPL